MKKILVIVGVCSLLITMPITTAIPTKLVKNSRILNPIMPSIKKQTVNLDDPPDWAKGNFTGVWGINILGIPLAPLGWIAGYYQRIGLGNLAGVFGGFNDTNATGEIVGIMLWIFFLGGVGSIETGNGTYVSGLGIANETHYYMRLNAIIGPSYYIFVKYAKFE